MSSRRLWAEAALSPTGALRECPLDSVSQGPRQTLEVVADHRKQSLQPADAVELPQESDPPGEGVYLPNPMGSPTAAHENGPPPLRYHDKLFVGTGPSHSLSFPRHFPEPRGRLVRGRSGLNTPPEGDGDLYTYTCSP